METRFIAIDIQPGYGQPSLKLHQGDVGIPVGFKVFDGGKEISSSEWETSHLNVTTPSGDDFDVPCEVTDDGIVFKVPEEMTDRAWNLISRLILSNQELTVRTEDILISVSGFDAYQQEKEESKAYEKVLTEAAKNYEAAKKEHEGISSELKDSLISAEAVKKDLTDAKKKLETAIEEYEKATSARSDYLNVLKRLETELTEARDELKKQSDKMLDSSLLLKRATEEKDAAKADYERIVSKLKYAMPVKQENQEPVIASDRSGHAVIDSTGRCFVYIKEVGTDYNVDLIPDDEGSLDVKKKYSKFFLVEGTPQLGFTWEVRISDNS